MNIHPTAIVSDTAEIADNVSIGPFSIIRDNVLIEEDVVIHDHVVIDTNTTLRKGCSVFHGAVVGGIPQDLKFSGEDTVTIIGKNTTIREFATIHRGTEDREQTVVGQNCLLMAYVHIAHDCILGDNVILANTVNLAGHVTIEDYVTIGGLVPIHQFVKIGQHSFVGGGYRVAKDIANSPGRGCAPAPSPRWSDSSR